MSSTSKSLACLEGALFRRDQQLRADAPAPRATMNEHLGDIAPMRLILRLRPDHLRSADDSPLIFGNDDDAFSTLRARRHFAPERFGFRVGHRQHEADGCATFDTVDEYFT